MQQRTNRAFHAARVCIHIHTRAQTGGYVHSQQRRTTLVVDLQDKYYSEKLDYRYRPAPNADSCASGGFVPIHRPARNVRVRVRLKNFRGAIAQPDLLDIQSCSPFLFPPDSCAPKRYPTEFRCISRSSRVMTSLGATTVDSLREFSRLAEIYVHRNIRRTRVSRCFAKRSDELWKISRKRRRLTKIKLLTEIRQ